jgi:adenylate cyclase class 2
MSLEIEKKYRIDPKTSKSIIRRLGEAGAVFDGEDNEENIIYSGGPLSVDSSVLRLRIVDNTTTLSYKRRLPGQEDIRRQIEFETQVADTVAMKEILDALGFFPALIYEKRRKRWCLADVEIVLDELPFGLFMEIEGPAEKIQLAERSLGIETLECVNETYPELTAKYGRRIESLVEARF